MEERYKISLALVRSDDGLRKLVAQLLHTYGFEVTCNFKEPADLIRHLGEGHFLPDVCLVDVDRYFTSLYYISELKKRWPEIKIMATTVDDHSETVYKVTRAGATGFVSKEWNYERWKEAIQQLHYRGHSLSDDSVISLLTYLASTRQKNRILSFG